MPVSTKDAQRCRDRAVFNRRLAAQTTDPDLRESYLRLALSYEALADSVQELDRTDTWFPAQLDRPVLGISVSGVSG
jgi:siroheme synthase (precorrin-2 oxidase/ferrochelatase)